MYMCTHEGKATQGAGMTFHLLLVSPHTEIMGVTQHIFYRLHLGFMNNFFFGFSCTNYRFCCHK